MNCSSRWDRAVAFLPGVAVIDRQSASLLSNRSGWRSKNPARRCQVAPSRPLAMSANSTRASGERRSGLLGALYRFTRPHTVRGTILGCIAGVARALLDHPSGPKVALNWSLYPRALLGVLALVLGNAYIVGVNQIFDVRIDKVNKPFLPLAAGDMSVRVAWGIVISSAVASLSIVRYAFSRFILGLFSFGMTFGTLYSIPPFRFKRFPVLAAITISCVRGFLMNFGVYHATLSALGLPFRWSPPIIFLAVFMSVFACVIAIAKDIPDIRGDVAEGVNTFAVRAGTATVIRVVAVLLGINYMGAVATAFLAPANVFRRPVLACGHAVLGTCLALRLRSVDPNSQNSVKSFYAFIWSLFYAEYALFPFI